MIPEVEGTRPWGPPGKRVPRCLKGPKTTYTTIAIAEKQSKRSKKGPSCPDTRTGEPFSARVAPSSTTAGASPWPHLSAPQAFRCTSGMSCDSSTTSGGMPPSARVFCFIGSSM